MKRILALALVLAGCGAPEIELTAATTHALGGAKPPTATSERDDGNSNPMPGRPPSPTTATPPASNPGGSNPMPGAPAPIADPLAPGSSNPMPGVTAVVDYTK